jgi:hypothetical protein
MNEFATFGTVVLAAVISLAAILVAVWPLLKPPRGRVLLEDDRLGELIGRKESTLKAIKDLEFDFRVGKMDEEDFQRLDQRLRRQAIGLIQQIDKLAPAGAAIDEALERQIAAMRRAQGPATPPASAARPLPASVATNGHTTTAPARYCTECGAALEATHKFCAQCGAPVAVQATPVPAGESSA